MKKYDEFISEKTIIIDNLNECNVLILESERKDLHLDVPFFLERKDGVTISRNDFIEINKNKYDVIFKYLNEMSDIQTQELIDKWRIILEDKKIKIKKIFKIKRNTEDFDENLLKESFESQPKDILWSKNENYWRGFFEVGDIEYRISIDEQDNGVFLYKFERKIEKDTWTYIKIGDSSVKNKMSVLSTVRYGFKYFMDERHPNGLIFTAMDDSSSRKKIYESFCMEIIRNYPYYQYRNDSNDKYQIFVLNKNDFDFKELKRIINKILNGNIISY